MPCASKIARAFLILVGLTSPVLAQDLPEKGPHSGIVRDVGDYRFELVVSVQTLIVYLLDHENNPLREVGLAAKAKIAAGDVSDQIYLTAYPGGVISGTGSFAVTGPLQVEITLNAPNGLALNASFGEVRLKTRSWPRLYPR